MQICGPIITLMHFKIGILYFCTLDCGNSMSCNRNPKHLESIRKTEKIKGLSSVRRPKLDSQRGKVSVGIAEGWHFTTPYVYFSQHCIPSLKNSSKETHEINQPITQFQDHPQAQEAPHSYTAHGTTEPLGAPHPSPCRLPCSRGKHQTLAPNVSSRAGPTFRRTRQESLPEPVVISLPVAWSGILPGTCGASDRPHEGGPARPPAATSALSPRPPPPAGGYHGNPERGFAGSEGKRAAGSPPPPPAASPPPPPGPGRPRRPHKGRPGGLNFPVPAPGEPRRRALYLRRRAGCAA